MPLRIFIVEDSSVIRENLIEMLEDLLDVSVVGWSSTETDGVQWLTCHSHAWDLALIDLFLEEGNGLGVLRSCAARARNQKMIVLSNYATQEIRRRSVAEGADAVFDKSHELDELMAYTAHLDNSA